MRAVVQRVSSAEVRVGGDIVGAIGEGLVVLVGVTRDDRVAESLALASKLAGLRIFSDAEGRMNRSLRDTGGSVLVVSQFTLLADASRGRRPSFTGAAEPEYAEPLVEEVAGALRSMDIEVATGRFGASMEVDLVNDGPVTLILEVSGGRIRPG